MVFFFQGEIEQLTVSSELDSAEKQCDVRPTLHHRDDSSADSSSNNSDNSNNSSDFDLDEDNPEGSRQRKLKSTHIDFVAKALLVKWPT